MKLNLEKFKKEAWEVIKISEEYLAKMEKWSTMVELFEEDLEKMKDDEELKTIQAKMDEISMKFG